MLMWILGGSILGVGLLVWSVTAINSYCEARYDYEPFSGWILFLLLVTMACGVAHFMFSGAAVGADVQSKRLLFENVDAADCIGAFSFLLAYVRVIFKTNFFIATYTMIAGMVLSAFALLMLIYLAQRERPRHFEA